jgi:hypothetical protein
VARPHYQQGSIESKGKNCWKIRWREYVLKEDGTITCIYHRETFRQVSKARAREILDAHLCEVRQRHLIRLDMTLKRFVEVEWKPNATLRLRKSSMRIYGFNLDKHILPALGEAALRDISRAQIETCLLGLQRKGYAVSTLRSVRATFATVFEAAISHRYIEENPAHRIRLREADSPREPRYYRAPEIRRLLLMLEEPCRSVIEGGTAQKLSLGKKAVANGLPIAIEGATGTSG